jgi:hypothetical protein
MGRCRTPAYMDHWTRPQGRVQNLHRHKPDSRDGSRTSLSGVRATHSTVPGFRDKKYPDLNQG